MFTVDIDPILISFLGFEVRYYGLIYAFGFLLALSFLLYAVKHKQLELTKQQVYDFMFYLILGVIIGARLFHVLFWDFSYYFNNHLKIFYVWEGGLSFHGGLVGGFLVTYFFSKKFKVSLWKLADILVVPAVFGLALGRIANFINQEILGTITDKPWCVRFLRADPENCRHPIQLYAAFGRFFTFFFLLSLKKYKEGFVFWMFILLISLGRGFLDFIREDFLYFYLRVGQWFSLVLLVVTLIVLFRGYREDLRRLLHIS